MGQLIFLSPFSGVGLAFECMNRSSLDRRSLVLGVGHGPEQGIYRKRLSQNFSPVPVLLLPEQGSEPAHIPTHVDGPDTRIMGPDFLHKLKTGFPWHFDVRNDEIRPEIEVFPITGRPVPGRSDLTPLRGDQLLNDRGCRLIIINNQDLHAAPLSTGIILQHPD